MFGLAVIAALLFVQRWPFAGVAPALLADENSGDAVLGASGTMATNETLKGPQNLTANQPLLYPPPLMGLNPITSQSISGG